ncbi:MAG: hypothetical protein ACRDPL_03025, partial [Propionibacteriaceae bacterium]
MAVVLSALAPSSSGADGPAMVVHSAKSGELKAGRLILRGVRGRVTWTRNDGSSGVVTVERVQRRLFVPGIPYATGLLHVAGQRGGDEPVFRLNRPRYSAVRRTVSYRARPIRRRGGSRGSAGAAQTSTPSQFGAASLSIVPHERLTGDDDDYHCSVGIFNETGYGLKQVSHSHWDTDVWKTELPDGTVVTSHSQTRSGDDIMAVWESDHTFLRGCSTTAIWELLVDPNDPTQAPPPAGAGFRVGLRWPWG